MLESVSRVMDRQRDIAATRPEWRSAWEGGTARWRDATCGMASAVALAALRRGQVGRAVKAGRFILETSPMAVPRGIARRLRKRARRSGSASLFRRVSRFFRGRPLGPIWLGSVGRTSPVDAHFGFGRGTPVDRHYINTFLASHREDIRGRVLEIGDSSYTTTFGTGVERSDVLHVHAGNPYATIVGDLSQPNVLPPDSFDCLVITQTLHCIYDIRSAVVHLRDALKPGGVALVTLPFISQVDRGEWGNTWYWGVAPAAAAAMFREVFGDRVEMEVFGNVYAATVFLQGLAFEEVSQRKLAVKDEAYPVLVAIRAERSHA
jgi:SAM-dependent methyltransferase